MTSSSEGSEASGVRLNLDVLSDHELWADADGNVIGIFYATTEPFTVGTQLDVDVRLPWGEEVVCTGVVEWRRDQSGAFLRDRAGIGIRIDPLCSAQARLIERLLVLRPAIKAPPECEPRCGDAPLSLRPRAPQKAGAR